MKRFLPKSAYARNVITLMTGTGMAQALPIAISPILTRLYSPEDFGLLALYISIVAILTVMVTARYELAIVLPKRDRDAMHVVALSIALSFIISTALFLIIFFFNASITRFFEVPEIAPWLYWVPFSTLVMGVYQSLNYWSNRRSQYKRLAISRTIQGSSTALLQLSAGSVAIGSAGLVGGDLAGRALSCAILARSVCTEDKRFIKNIRKIRIFSMARRYINFPKYLIVAHSINTFSFQLPILLLGILFGSTVPGFYMLTQRIMGAPSALIAGAIGDVFRQEASHFYINNGNCLQIYKKTFKKLLLLSFAPFLVFFFVAPELFAFIFGEKWRTAGEYAQVLTPMFFMQFITSPLSAMFMIGEKQKIDLFWQISLLGSVFLALYIGAYIGGVYGALIFFSTAYSLMYLFSGIISYRISGGK